MSIVPQRKWVKRAFWDIFDAEVGDRALTQRDRRRLYNEISKGFESAELWAPSHLELLVSEECNLRCDYCFMANKNPKTMSLETGKQSVDFLVRESPLDQVSILFFGGEPLLAFPTICGIVEYADRVVKEAGKTIHYAMTTNGTLCNEEVLSFCTAHDISPLISIDGLPTVHDLHRKTCAGTGSYSLIERNLPTIFKYMPNPQVRVTPHPDTVDQLSKSIEHLVEVGFRRFIIGAAHGIEWTEDEYDVFDRQMEQVINAAFTEGCKHPKYDIQELSGPLGGCSWGCRAGRGYLCVGADGRLSPCSLIMGTPGLGEQYIFGNVKDGITNKKARAEFCVLGANRTSECQKCDLAETCSGGCPGTNYVSRGSIVHPSKQQCLDQRYKVRHKEIWKRNMMQLGTNTTETKEQ